MSLDENKSLMRRFYEEFWCKGNADAVDELAAPDFVDHQLPAGWPQGRDGLKKLVREWRTGFPDMHETIEDLIAEGDRVTGRFILTGTHQGPFLGIDPTGEQVRLSGIDIVRMEDGRIAEWWYSEDTMGLLRQLGQLPPDGPL